MLDGSHLVELIGSRPALAVTHAGHHVELNRLVHGGFSCRTSDLREVVDAVRRGDLLIGPAVIHQQLAAAIEERLQIDDRRVDHAVVDAVRQFDVRRGIEAPPSQPASLKTTYLNASSAVPIGSGPASVAHPSSEPRSRSAGNRTAPV